MIRDIGIRSERLDDVRCKPQASSRHPAGYAATETVPATGTEGASNGPSYLPAKKGKHLFKDFHTEIAQAF